MVRWQGNSMKGKVGMWNDDDGSSWMHCSRPDQGASHMFISTYRQNSLRSRMQATTQNIGCAECNCLFLSLAQLQALQRYDQNNIDLLVLSITQPVLVRFERSRAHFKADGFQNCAPYPHPCAPVPPTCKGEGDPCPSLDLEEYWVY